jgi:hypothetical protein
LRSGVIVVAQFNTREWRVIMDGRGGDRRSKAFQAAHLDRVDSSAALVTKIGALQNERDQTFFEKIRELRQQHGNPAVDKAMNALRQQHDAVAVAPQRRGPAFPGRQDQAAGR